LFVYNFGCKNINKYIFREQERMEAYWEESLDLSEEVNLGWRFRKYDEEDDYIN
jgi:hypothetical protein